MTPTIATLYAQPTEGRPLSPRALQFNAEQRAYTAIREGRLAACSPLVEQVKAARLTRSSWARHPHPLL